MKKIFLSFLVCGLIYTATAQTDSTTTNTATTTNHKYYYYPSSNVYFDEPSSSYWYWDNATAKWSTTPALPSTITLTETDRQELTYNGNDPWKNNAEDKVKYKSKNGKEKIKTDSLKTKIKDR